MVIPPLMVSLAVFGFVAASIFLHTSTNGIGRQMKVFCFSASLVLKSVGNDDIITIVNLTQVRRGLFRISSLNADFPPTWNLQKNSCGFPSLQFLTPIWSSDTLHDPEEHVQIWGKIFLTRTLYDAYQSIEQNFFLAYCTPGTLVFIQK